MFAEVELTETGKTRFDLNKRTTGAHKCFAEPPDPRAPEQARKFSHRSLASVHPTTGPVWEIDNEERVMLTEFHVEPPQRHFDHTFDR